jgi:serine/threonine protein kinase/Tol biopolymer transport system component
MALTKGSRLGPFEIVSPVGAGGMGEVWRATDGRLQRDVALKMLPADVAAHPDRVARFEREARLLAALSHPGIATLFGVEQIDGRSVLVMELAEGEDLAQRLRRGPLPLDEALSIARQVAEALEAAHEKGIVHRDLKPANVKVTPDGRVKVLDFGLARAWTDEGAGPDRSEAPTLADTRTTAGLIVGTAAYMSPEQARGRAVDRRTDVWAFGALLFEMLTGRRLFAGETLSDTLAAVLERDIDWSALPAATPPSVRRVLSRCLVRDPRQRLHDVADARIELEDRSEVAAEKTGARRPSLLARAAPWAVAAAAVVLGALAFLRGRTSVPPSPPRVHFTVSPPAAGSFESYPALSPDGRRLAYVLLPENGPSSLWLHSLERGTARELPGTENADEPFWSPDGRSVAFFAGGELRKIDVTSGAVQSLCTVPDPRGGTWGSRGDILFATGAASGLRRVRAAGGPVEVLTTVDNARGEQGHKFPWFLPDGRHYVFSILGSAEAVGIYFGDTAGGAYRKLTSDLSRAAYDPHGDLLFLRERTLLAQRLDAVRGALEGDPSPVAASGVGRDVQFGVASWFSAGAAAVAFRPGAVQESRLVWVDRRGGAVGEVTGPGAYMEPALSRDGSRVVAEVVSPDLSRIDLWTFEASGRDQGRRLPLDANTAFAPRWSPDGKWIAYRARGGGARGGTLARRAASGAGREEVLVAGGPERFPNDWSPDGRVLLFEQYGEFTGGDLWTLDAEPPHATRPVLEGPSDETHAAFSPDGRLFAYTSDETGLPQVFVQTFPPSGAKWQVSAAGGDEAAWRADGREIYFVGLDRVLYAVAVRSLEPLVAGAPEPLFRLRIPRIAATGGVQYAPAPDGRRFLVDRLESDEASSRIDVILNWAARGSLDETPRPSR